MKVTAVPIVAFFAAVVSAVTTADTSKSPSGNAIYNPGLDQQVEVGKPFEISWNPTTSGNVSIILLRGPSEDVQPIATIADSISNDGSYSWTPSTSLENDKTHYGIEIVVEGTGQYQYSPQFGIKNDKTSSSSVAVKEVSTGSHVSKTTSVASTASITHEASSASQTLTVVSASETSTPSSSSAAASQTPVATPVTTLKQRPQQTPYMTASAVSAAPSASASGSSHSQGTTPPYSNGASGNIAAYGGVVLGALAAFAF